MPTPGITSVSYGGRNGNGDDFYVTVGKRIADFYTGKISRQSPGTAMYVVKGMGSGNSFRRYKAY